METYGPKPWPEMNGKNMSLEQAFEPYELLRMSVEEIRNSDAEHEAYIHAWRLHRRGLPHGSDESGAAKGEALLERAIDTYFLWSAICHLLTQDITQGRLPDVNAETTLDEMAAHYRQEVYRRYPRLRRLVRRKLTGYKTLAEINSTVEDDLLSADFPDEPALPLDRQLHIVRHFPPEEWFARGVTRKGLRELRRQNAEPARRQAMDAALMIPWKHLALLMMEDMLCDDTIRGRTPGETLLRYRAELYRLYPELFICGEVGRAGDSRNDHGRPDHGMEHGAADGPPRRETPASPSRTAPNVRRRKKRSRNARAQLHPPAADSSLSPPARPPKTVCKP
jgi:hypothetical protein